MSCYPKSSKGGEALSHEAGQAAVLLILILGVFLLASVSFAVDFSNLWFLRQAAQTAADAACQAGAMDMLYAAQGTSLPDMGFTPGAAGNCATSSAATMCAYAKYNGFAPTSGGFSSTAPSVAVSWTFPSSNSVSGVTPAGGTPYPFLQVLVQDNVKTWFMGLLGKNYQAVAASCTCGLLPGPQQAPLMVLNPAASGALSISGGTIIKIAGGVQNSVQINSTSPTAFSCSGSGLLDTSTAGPGSAGGNVSIVGGPPAAPTCGGGSAWSGGTTGKWSGGVAAATNPYANVPAIPMQGEPVVAANPVPGYTPSVDPTYGNIDGTWVTTGVDSCPNTNPAQHYLTYNSKYGNVYGNCLEFNPGYYPSGIDTSSLAGYSGDVVIFQPGIYYLNGNLVVGSSTTIRNVWPATEPSTEGVVFYFLSGGPEFGGGSGAPNSSINSIPSYYLNCSGAGTPSGMPASLTGNVLVSQCSAAGTYVGLPSTDTFSASGVRGLLFFLAPSNSFDGAVVGAGASLSFSGAFYFHNLSYNDVLTWNGAGASTTYAVGNIVVDQLSLSGSGTIQMSLTGSSGSSAPAQVGLFE